jgi:hypothetical protein
VRRLLAPECKARSTMRQARLLSHTRKGEL